MMFNPYLAQRLAQERTRDVAHQAEQARLVRAANGMDVAGQAALQGLLVKLRGLVLPRISVKHTEHKVPMPQ